MLLLFAAVVLVAGLIAVPAAAAATHVVDGQGAEHDRHLGQVHDPQRHAHGHERTTPVALGGQTVRVEWSLTGAPLSWNLLAEVTTDDGQYATGQYAAVVYPTQLTYYRFIFLGAGSYDRGHE